MNRKQALITGAATLAVLAAIPLTSALADTTPKRDQHAAPVADAPSTLLAAMRRDLGITDGQARTRLAQEAAAPTIERRLHDQLGDTYAGAWFDASTNKLVVGVTDSAKAKTVTTEGATPKVVTHSERDLTGAKDTLDRSARSAGPVAIMAMRSRFRSRGATATRRLIPMLQAARATAPMFSASRGLKRTMATRSRQTRADGSGVLTFSCMPSL